MGRRCPLGHQPDYANRQRPVIQRRQTVGQLPAVPALVLESMRIGKEGALLDCATPAAVVAVMFV